LVLFIKMTENPIKISGIKSTCSDKMTCSYLIQAVGPSMFDSIFGPDIMGVLSK